jgi:hypothetical protein
MRPRTAEKPVEGVCRMKRVALALLLGSLLIGGSVAHAASTKSHGSQASGAWLEASPNAVAADGTPFDVDGCGFKTGVVVDMVLTDDASVYFFPAATNGEGCISFTWWSGPPGTMKVDGFQSVHNRRLLMASTTVDVEG